MFLSRRIVYASIILMYFQTWCNCLRNDSCVRLQQSNCAAVEMTIFSTKGDKIFSTRVASFTSCGLSQDWSTSWVNIGQLLGGRFWSFFVFMQPSIFFGDQQFDPYPSLSSARWTANHMILAQRFDLLAKTYKNLLQIGPSTPCSVCATSGGDFETSYNFYQVSHVERSCSTFRVSHEVSGMSKEALWSTGP